MGHSPSGLGVGGPLMCKSCKLVGVSPCWLGVGGEGWGVPLVYECCKLVGGTPCGLKVGGGGPFSV